MLAGTARFTIVDERQRAGRPMARERGADGFPCGGEGNASDKWPGQFGLLMEMGGSGGTGACRIGGTRELAGLCRYARREGATEKARQDGGSPSGATVQHRSRCRLPLRRWTSRHPGEHRVGTRPLLDRPDQPRGLLAACKLHRIHIGKRV